jgi:hypothetical protein
MISYSEDVFLRDERHAGVLRTMVVPGSNLGPETGYLDEVFGLRHFLQTNARKISQN